MFELTKDEYNALEIRLRSQIVTLNNKRGTNIKYAPLAFTEQGVAMSQLAAKQKEINSESPRPRIGFKK